MWICGICNSLLDVLADRKGKDLTKVHRVKPGFPVLQYIDGYLEITDFIYKVLTNALVPWAHLTAIIVTQYWCAL